VRVPRRAPVRFHRFSDFFKGFENVDAVRRTFGSRGKRQTARLLSRVKVEFFSSRFGYMGVSDDDGHLLVSTFYLRTGAPRDIYLDTIHELVHVKQHRDGRPLFNPRYEYVDRPTELEAYRVCTAEARRIGMTDAEILRYLKVFWLSDAEVRRLARKCGVRPARRVPRNARTGGERRR
jgi:hypothetical protein